MRRIWIWLMIFAWRKAALAITEMPMGIPTYRDPNALCPAYSPRKRKFGEWSDCETVSFGFRT